MNSPKPLFGTIAHSGGTYTVTYHEESEPVIAVNITRQGYSAENVQGYLEKARQIGAVICTVKDVIAN